VFSGFELEPHQPCLAQSQSIPNPPTSSEINDLAAALVRATSEEELERVLARNSVLMNTSHLAALKALTDPLIKNGEKGDYAQALRISQLVVRVAERIGDQVEMGNTLYDLGHVYQLQNRDELRVLFNEFHKFVHLAMFLSKS
jgi:hypothetical protein